MIKDMTKGKTLPIIISFGIPMLLGSLFQQLYNLVDSIIVGKFISADALAAVGVAGAVNFLIIGFVIGMTGGICIPVAQCFGAGDVVNMRRYVANSFYLAAFFSIVLTFVSVIYTRKILELMNTPADIIDKSHDYLLMTFIGLGVTMMYNLLASILRALGDSKTPLYFLAIAAVLNIIFDFVFIFAFNWGVGGVGLATVVSQAFAVALCIIYLVKNYSILRFQKGELKPSWKHMLKQLSIGIPMALQFSITAIGSIILQTAINSLGTMYVTAVTTANRLTMLIVQPMEAIGITMATFSGQNLGAGKVLRIRRGIVVSLRILLVYSVIAGLVLSLFGRYLGMIFVSSQETEILDNVLYFLRIVSLSYPFLAVLFVLRSSLQGLGYSFVTMFAGVAELVARAFTAFLLVVPFGFTGVAVSSPIAWVLADVILIPAYFIVMYRLKNTS